MEKAGCNTFSVGIFAWATLEPEEGRFEFALARRHHEPASPRGASTPSSRRRAAAKPRWMSEKYEEVRRINAQGRRELHGSRHNHCFTSPVYREKVRIINTKLAERYKGHQALAGWHISNEYSGACYCNYCLAAFRAWLKTRYAVARRAQPGVLDGVLEPEVPVVGPDRPARERRWTGSSSTGTAS